jgi:antitoxin HicB
MMKIKNVEYYLKLPYKIEIRKIPESLGGGFEASIPQLGREAFSGDGETIEEALKSLEEVKKDLFESYLEEGENIPEPELDDAEYSGKFVLRIPKTLHRALAQKAKDEGLSLNQYCIYLLTRNIDVSSLHEKIESLARSTGNYISGSNKSPSKPHQKFTTMLGKSILRLPVIRKYGYAKIHAKTHSKT